MSNPTPTYWNKSWRKQVWAELESSVWDIIIIGGGITGAGLFREAVNAGLKTLLVEQHDFSFGTSGRSSKLIHGGMRYLRNRQYSVTRESVHEREWLLHAAPHLVMPLSFILPYYEHNTASGATFHTGIILYDIMGRKWKHRSYNRSQIADTLPVLNRQGIKGAFQYYDARVDDSRLVLRLLREGSYNGGTALNYAKVERFLRTRDGQVCGVQLRDFSDMEHRHTAAVQADVVINASGPWSDELLSIINAPARLRKQRGSHLVFSRQRLPLDHAVTLHHPDDHRAMFAIPWEGVILIGTTDIDHASGLDKSQDEPCANEAEIEYILRAARATFPETDLNSDDIISTFAGIRPIINTGKAHPSQESRAHAIWEEDGLLTITGGKLTIFRKMARDALLAVRPRLRGKPKFPIGKAFFERLPNPALATLPDSEDWFYLAGRYGMDTPEIIAGADPEYLGHIESLPNLWAELRWSARSEAVVHLDDLLLRRVRLGLLLPDGAQALLPQIRNLVQSELEWNDARWTQEVNIYHGIWERYYSPHPMG